VLSESADEYRAWAAQCAAMAARGGREEDKRAWLQLAEKWRALADQADDNKRVAQLAQQMPGEEAVNAPGEARENPRVAFAQPLPGRR
jgi:hypothetical protein